jgi:alkaline phosphatase D
VIAPRSGGGDRPVSRAVSWTLLIAVLTLPGGTAAARPDRPAVSHGVVVGDVSARSAVLWTRADRRGTLQVKLSGGSHRPTEPVPVEAADDWTGHVRLSGLAPGTSYSYRVRFSPGGHFERGSFRTPPADDVAAPVRLAFGGDVAGQNVCRDAAQGFPILETVRGWRPDLFVGLGDMIYADNACAAVGLYGNAQLPGDFGPATDLASFRAHWRYNRADPASRRLLASTGYVGVWDDHEVINDFGPLSDTGSTPPYTPGVHLLPTGRQAFLDYTPVKSAPERLYRSLRWGRHLELFVLDTRSHRDANSAADSAAQPTGTRSSSCTRSPPARSTPASSRTAASTRP